jgi:cell wall-associated NlpC family hydrolase
LADIGKKTGPGEYHLSRAGRKLYSTRAERSRIRKSTSQRLSRNAGHIVDAAMTSINEAVDVASTKVTSVTAIAAPKPSFAPASSTSLRRRLATVGVSALAFGLVGTFALPSYALTPGTIESEYGQALAAQSISAHNALTDASRPTSVSIAEVAVDNIVRPVYDGPSVRDYLENPPYPNFDLAQVFEVAKQYIGTPYLAYGANPAGFDCSGFTQFVYAQFGVPLVHLASAQMNAGTIIAEADAVPGDLVWMPGHIGFWAGPGMMLDSPTEGKAIDIRPIWSNYYVVFRVGIN